MQFPIAKMCIKYQIAYVEFIQMYCMVPAKSSLFHFGIQTVLEAGM